MKNLLILSLFFFIVGCESDQVIPDETSSSNLKMTVGNEQYESYQSELDGGTITSDAFNINKVEVTDHLLNIQVSYSGGCEIHEFEVLWPEMSIAIFPPQFSVILHHNGNGDLCEAYLTETLTIDPSIAPMNLSKEAIEGMKVTVINGSKPDQQVSN